VEGIDRGADRDEREGMGKNREMKGEGSAYAPMCIFKFSLD